MKTVSLMTAAAALLLSGLANAAEIKVLSTQATEEAYKELVPQFEKVSGHKVTTVFTGTLDVQKRIGAGEMYDLLIMAGPSLPYLLKFRAVGGRGPAGHAQAAHGASRPQ